MSGDAFVFPSTIMKRVWTVGHTDGLANMGGRDNDSGDGTSALLQDEMTRRQSTPSMMFSEFRSSPLHDLAPIAQPGIHTRVVRHGKVAATRENLSQTFDNITSEDDLLMIGGCSPSLVWAALMAVCPAMQYGWNNGNMNTAALVMRKDLLIPMGGGPIADNAWGFCISVFCLGALLGCSLGASLADSYGRRRAILFNAAVYLVGGVMEAFSAQRVQLMMLGRLVSGVASGWTTVVVPVYLGEIAPPHLRGALGTGFQLAMVFGMLMAQILGLPMFLGTEDTWPLYIMVVVLPNIALLFGNRMLVESPCWLAGRSADEVVQARDVLGALRGQDPTEEGTLNELEQMKARARAEDDAAFLKPDTPKYGLRQMLSDKAVRPGLTICVVCSLGQQFSGINNAFNYSTTFLTANGIDPTTVVIIAVLMNLGNVLVSFASAMLMDSLGRRPLLLISASGMAVSILGLTLAMSSPGQSWTSTLAVLAVVCFVASFGVGLGPIPWLLPAELMPMDKCAKGANVAATVNWLANFIVGQSFPVISAALKGYCFLPNTLVLLVFIVVVHRCLPETRGKTIDQILAELSPPAGK